MGWGFFVECLFVWGCFCSFGGGFFGCGCFGVFFLACVKMDRNNLRAVPGPIGTAFSQHATEDVGECF